MSPRLLAACLRRRLPALGHGLGQGLALVCLGLWGTPIQAQGATEPPPGLSVRSPVLIIDFERLFAQSLYGQRVARGIEAEGRALIEENDRIESELSAEELELTEKRDTLAPEEFRLLADAFDAKVQQLRNAQQAKAEEVGQGREAAERRFRQTVTPIIARLMQEAGAVVVLERGDGVVWVEAIDITDAVLRRADAVIGDGRTPRDLTMPSDPPSVPLSSALPEPEGPQETAPETAPETAQDPDPDPVPDAPATAATPTAPGDSP